MSEKRLHPRLDLPLQVDLMVGGEQRLATLENLSAGGAALRFPEFLNPGSLIERLRFDLPNGANGGGDEIVAAAKVVRAEPIRQAAGEGGFQLGVSFENLPDDTFRRIQQFIYQRLTKGSPQFDEMPLERRRIAVEQQVAVSFDRFDEFVSEVAENISMSGMFLRTPDPKPPGTEFSFQFRLGDDFALIEGRAEVVWTRRKSLGAGKAAGMGVRFLQLDDASRRTIRKLVEDASAAQRLDKPSSGKVRVAAVFPKAPSKARATAKKAAAPSAAAAPRPGGDVEKLRRELGRRTRAYEEKIERLSLKIVELTTKREDRTVAATSAAGTASETHQALVEEKAQLEQQCQRLKQERGDLQAQLTAVTEELAAQREETESARSEIAAERRSRAGLDNRLRAVEQALRHSETERDRSQQRLKEVTSARDELAARLEEGGLVDASEHDKLSRRLAEESAERARLAEQVARVARERSDLEQRLEAAVAKAVALQEREEKHRELTSRLATLEAEHSNLEILLSGATTDRAELEREVTRLREQDRERRQEEAAEESERQQLHEALERARFEAERAQADRAELEGEVERLRKQDEERRQREAADESERQELQQALERARSEVEEAHADGMRLAGELRGQLEALKAEERSLVDQVTALEEERDELERELAARREAEKSGLRRLESLESELEEVRGELVATAANRERRVGTLEWVLAEARSEKLDLEDRLAALERGRAELEERFEARGETVATQLANLEAAERERQQVEELLQSIRSEAEAQREAFTSRLAELEESGARLAATEQAERERAEELARELEETAARLETAEREAHGRAEELTRELEETAARLETREREARELEEAAARLETTEREAGERVEELTRELEEAAARLETTEREARERVEELSRELEERDRVVGEVHEQMGALEGRLRASEEASEELREEASRLEVEAEELRRQRQILETQARSAEEDMGGELAAVRQQLKELTDESAEFEQTAEARRRQIEALEDQLVGERERAAELVVKAEEAAQSRRRLEEENETLQNAVRAVTTAAGVEGVPVPILEAKAERRGGASLRRAAGIAGGGILLAALLWGGFKVMPWPGASSPEVSAPVLVGGKGPAARDNQAPELPVAAEAAAPRPAATAVGGVDAVESGEEALNAGTLAPPPPPRPAPDETVEAWAEAWSGQRVEDYLAAYSREFVPPNDLSRPEWEAFRRERLESPPWIRVNLGQIAQEQLADDRVQVVFTQDYAAGAYSDRVEKTLVLVWEEGAWKILEERSVAL